MLTLCFFFGSGIAQGTNSPDVPYSLVGEVAPSIFSEFGGIPAITSFNISGDGTHLVLLYKTGKGRNGVPGNDELWAALWDIAGKRIVERTKVANNDLVVPAHGSDPKRAIFNENYLFTLKLKTDVIFSSDQASIIVMGFGKVLVLDAKTFSVVHSLKPPNFELSAPVQIQALRTNTVALTFEYGFQLFEVVFFDASTASEIANWTSPVVPQSYSPDGKLAVAPDPNTFNNGGVANVAVLNAQTGAKVKSIPVGFGFKNGWLANESAHGSVVARFLNDDQIVVTPDGDRNAAGHRAGDDLEIIDIAQGRIVRDIRPQKYGPTGILAESRDHSHYLVESIYASPARFSMESTNPKHFIHQIIVFAKDGTTPEAVFPYPVPKIEDYRMPVLNVPPRISDDGATIAVGVADSVQVLHLKR